MYHTIPQLESLQPYLGPRAITITEKENWQNLSGVINLFVFNYFAISDPDKIYLLNHACGVCNVDLTSWEFAVNGEEEVLGDLSDFWMTWGTDELAPFSFISSDAKGPYTFFDAILLFDTRDKENIADMPVILFSKEANTVTKVEILLQS